MSIKNKKLDKFHFSFHLVNRFLIHIPNHKLSSENLRNTVSR